MSTSPSQLRNRLIDETSPYLLQHANNPVHWQPWDNASLETARREQKPILLSIGYSSCHWCHVMAHESFADPEIAQVMNEHFINIKVDREERPDLDKVYQIAHHVITQQNGGWPLTMFLDPETLVPFFGGTYFPKTPRYQLPGFVDLLLRITSVFDSKRDELNAQGEKITEVLSSLAPSDVNPGLKEDIELIDEAGQKLAQQYDTAEGGFGDAPKFPMPGTLDFLLRSWALKNRAGTSGGDTLDQVMHTLTKMARGGIFDHVGGGFCRYSTDGKWMIPHFEKMLYDNGQLLALYTDALAITSDELFRQTIQDTVGWLTREMQHSRGAFFSALDADSEGEEGKFYVWRREQVKKLLTEQEYLVVETLYGLDKPANFENKWNFHRHDAWRSVVERLSLTRETADASLARAKQKLLTARDERIRPGLDDKILTAWNGLVIKGLAKAGQCLQRSEWIDSASQAVQFVRRQLWNDSERCLYATWKGAPRYRGYLDDYANLLDGLLALLAARWQDDLAQFARTLADTMIERFYDQDTGGFYFTARDHETLIHRPKPTMDDALPPGNGVAARVLIDLGHLFGETHYLDTAAHTLLWARAAMEQYPTGHCTLLSALQRHVFEPSLVILRGPEAEIRKWQDALNTGYQPWQQIYAIPYTGVTRVPAYLPALVSTQTQEVPTAYVCRGLQCSLPIESLEGVRKELSN